MKKYKYYNKKIMNFYKNQINNILIKQIKLKIYKMKIKYYNNN